MNADEIVRALKSNAEVNHHAAVMMMAADLIETLQAQLAASQRRADAAVRDLNHIANAIANSKQLLDGGEETVACLNLGQCGVCKEACDGSGCRFEWRGPQAEEGAENE